MADKTLNVKIQLRNDLEANWEDKDPVLKKGEIGIIVDVASENNGRFKIGDGYNAWSLLSFATPNDSSIETIAGTKFDTKLATVKGVASGLATLDANQKLTSSQLPAGVVSTGTDGKIATTVLPASVVTTGTDGKISADMIPATVLSGVVSADSVANLPTTGEEGKIYIVTSGGTSTQYRWDGSAYVEIPAGGVTVGTTAGSAYDGAAGAALASSVSGLAAGTTNVSVDCLVNDDTNAFILNCGNATV